MKKFVYSIIILCSFSVQSQTYLHPSVGLNSTYSGGCREHTCSGLYYDNGGPAANYSNNINQIYQTFCPDQDNVCLRVNFSSWELESEWIWGWSHYDWLQVLNGPAQNSPSFGYLVNTGTNVTFTSSHSSGCLTFVNYTDGSVTRPGWTAQFSCVPCAEREPNGNSDCPNAQQICSNAPLSGDSPGPGTLGEGCAGCAEAEGEVFSSWYYFEIEAGGTLAFDLVPNNSGEDLDFALYGPNVDCGTLGTPIRCSYALNTGTGGMRPSEGVNSEGVYGGGVAPGWVNDLNVNTGEQYVLLINNWSDGGGGYTINWTGTADLECAPVALPVELKDFMGNDKPGFNELKWSTSSERDNDYFRVEKSIDGQLWFPVADIKGAGNSSLKMDYSIQDKDIENNIIYYYRLKQFDFDGKMETHDDIVAILNNHAKPHIVKVINTLGQEVSIDATGLIFEIYSDGSRVKKFNP